MKTQESPHIIPENKTGKKVIYDLFFLSCLLAFSVVVHLFIVSLNRNQQIKLMEQELAESYLKQEILIQQFDKTVSEIADFEADRNDQIRKLKKEIMDLKATLQP